MDHLLQLLASESTRRLVWGLVPRAIGLTFLVAYASLWRQILPLLGARGVEPVARQLARLREDLPFAARLRLHPSLLWIAHSDRALRIYVGGGMLAALGMMLGGPAARLCALYCWAVWLSLHFPMRLVYPWDTVLLESGFLCLFMPSSAPPPVWAATELPHPLLPFIFQLLIFRVLLGFGKTKFLGIKRSDWNYTRYFLMNMPLCTTIGWRFSKLPDIVHKVTLCGIAFVELVCPILVLIPGPARLVGAASIIGQMIGIQLTGNFGYFNLMTTALCVSALDVTPSLMTALADPSALVTPSRLPFTIVAAFTTVATPIALIFNNWFTYGFLSWPAFERLPQGPLRWLLALLRLVEPLHLVNSYGVFRPGPAPPLRWVTVFEGSDDGESWRKYIYHFTMTDERSRPRFVAPHHPRLDHLTFYDAVGVDGTGYFHPVSFGNPYLFTCASLLDRTMQRLVEPGSPGARLFADAPFTERPPSLARVALYRFTSTTPEELARTGQHWNVRPIGLHIVPTGPDPSVWEKWMPPPELFHHEAPRWRARARTCRGISAAELDAFWNDFLPFVKRTASAIAPGDPYSWQVLPPLQLALRQRYSRDEVRRFLLTLGRLGIVLMARFDAVFDRPARHFWRDVAGFPKRERPDVDPGAPPPGTDPERVWQALAAWPHGALRTRFHVGLLSRSIVLEGREAWEHAAGRDASIAGTGARIPTRAPLSRRGRQSMSAAAAELGLELETLVDAARILTIPRGMFLEGVLDYEMLSRQASRLRVLYSYDRTYSAAPTGIFPGVFELAAQLSTDVELPMMCGWGVEARLVDLVNPPRMVFGDDWEWRELAPRETTHATQPTHATVR